LSGSGRALSTPEKKEEKRVEAVEKGKNAGRPQRFRKRTLQRNSPYEKRSCARRTREPCGRSRPEKGKRMIQFNLHTPGRRKGRVKPFLARKRGKKGLTEEKGGEEDALGQEAKKRRSFSGSYWQGREKVEMSGNVTKKDFRLPRKKKLLSSTKKRGKASAQRRGERVKRCPKLEKKLTSIYPAQKEIRSKAFRGKKTRPARIFQGENHTQPISGRGKGIASPQETKEGASGFLPKKKRKTHD